MSMVPTRGEAYAKLIEYLRQAQEQASTLAHLYRDDPVTGRAMAMGWLTIEQALKQMQYQVTVLAKRGLQ